MSSQYLKELTTQKATEIREKIKDGRIYGIQIDPTDSDSLLVAAYYLGLTEHNNQFLDLITGPDYHSPRQEPLPKSALHFQSKPGQAPDVTIVLDPDRPTDARYNFQDENFIINFDSQEEKWIIQKPESKWWETLLDHINKDGLVKDLRNLMLSQLRLTKTDGTKKYNSIGEVEHDNRHAHQLLTILTGNHKQDTDTNIDLKNDQP